MLKNWLLHKANGHQCVHSSLEFDPMEDEESYAIQCDPVQQRGRGLASLPQAVDEELCECPRTAGHVVVVATRNEIERRQRYVNSMRGERITKAQRKTRWSSPSCCGYACALVKENSARARGADRTPLCSVLSSKQGEGDSAQL
ncbi:hypothetical protein L596_010691 [Steinernema carpocapsae]|uniref:Uncharacterized protein n=1 Tax=Steinernema carpocapsae TaxID=34508 RepID=A0A4U5PJA1_STECR|nr:hypothetical protein L596_010691 [Steinernema carpocapsae]